MSSWPLENADAHDHGGAMSVPYVPLRVFCCLTMLEAAIDPETIASQAAQLGFPAAAKIDRVLWLYEGLLE